MVDLEKWKLKQVSGFFETCQKKLASCIDISKRNHPSKTFPK